jgi:hypothetical protein
MCHSSHQPLDGGIKTGNKKKKKKKKKRQTFTQLITTENFTVHPPRMLQVYNMISFVD